MIQHYTQSAPPRRTTLLSILLTKKTQENQFGRVAGMSLSDQLRRVNAQISMARGDKISIIAGSLILGLLRILPAATQNGYDLDRYIRLMRGRIERVPDMPNERAKLAGIAYDAMMALADFFPREKNGDVHISTFVESLSFSFEKELSAFYGDNYMDFMARACLKLEQSTASAKNSYEIADKLRDNIRKLIFERVDKK